MVIKHSISKKFHLRPATGARLRCVAVYTGSCFGLHLDIFQESLVLKNGSLGRWLDYGGIQRGSSIRWAKAGHRWSCLEGLISLPASSLHSPSWWPWGEQLLSPMPLCHCPALETDDHGAKLWAGNLSSCTVGVGYCAPVMKKVTETAPQSQSGDLFNSTLIVLFPRGVLFCFVLLLSCWNRFPTM